MRKMINDVAAYRRIVEESAAENKKKFLVTGLNYSKRAGEGIKEPVFYPGIPLYQELEGRYNLAAIAGEGDTLTKARRLMGWLTAHTYYCGMQTKLLPDDGRKILAFAYDKGFFYALNCRDKAIAFADCLGAIGLRSVPICLMAVAESKGKPTLNNHFLVHVYLNETGKWALLDPSFNVVFCDGNGETVDIFTLADFVRQGLPYSVEGYQFNGSEEGEELYRRLFVEGTMQYLGLWKNNIRAFRFSLNRWDRSHVDTAYYIVSPEGCDFGKDSKPFLKKKSKTFLSAGRRDVLDLR